MLHLLIIPHLTLLNLCKTMGFEQHNKSIIKLLVFKNFINYFLSVKALIISLINIKNIYYLNKILFKSNITLLISNIFFLYLYLFLNKFII